MPEEEIDQESYTAGRSSDEDTEKGFIAWQGRLKKINRFRWIIPILAVVLGWGIMLTILSAIEQGMTSWGWVGTFSIVAVYVYYIVGMPLYERRKLSEGSVLACIYTANYANYYLRKRNPLKASLYIDTLLLALSHFLREKSVAMGKKTVAPRDFMSVVPEDIPRRAVFKSIQANKNTKGFQRMLNELGSGLLKSLYDKDAGYIATNEFLTSLDQRIEAYRQVSRTFRDKHPNMVTVVKVMERGVVVLPPLVVLIFEALQ